MTDRESILEDLIVALFPDAIIESHDWTRCCTTFQPDPADAVRGHATLHPDGSVTIDWT